MKFEKINLVIKSKFCPFIYMFLRQFWFVGYINKMKVFSVQIEFSEKNHLELFKGSVKVMEEIRRKNFSNEKI